MEEKNYTFYVESEASNDFVKFLVENSLEAKPIGFIDDNKYLIAWETLEIKNAWDILLYDKNFEDLVKEFTKRGLILERIKLFGNIKYGYIVGKESVLEF